MSARRVSTLRVVSDEQEDAAEMGRIDVYRADVIIGPDIRGEVWSCRPIPDCVYPAPDGDIGGHGVQCSWCSRFVIEVPDAYVLAADPETGVDGVPDPERPDGFITLGPRVLFDRSGRDPGFKLIHVDWRYWENQAAIDRIEANRQRSSGGDGPDPAG